MSEEILVYLVYLLPITLVLFYYVRGQNRRAKVHAETLRETVDAGLTEPATLHPVFDPNLCIGSGSCVSACPENAIGIINGKAVLITPAVCIGHGACEASCAFSAIKLVFGTEKRGVDIPQVKPNFETNVPGIFIAGELGGMGLIRKAVEQGNQAITTISKRKKSNAPYDVVIVGSGPAGMSSTLSAHENKLRYVTIEQESTFGGTTLHYPRGKLVMTAPMNLPIYGKVNFRETNKEALMELWEDVVQKTGIKINFGERMESIDHQPDGTFKVVTGRETYHTNSILLSIGRRGTPRKLDVPGEELEKVMYRLIDPAQFAGKHVLVVGGGDAALEAAVTISEEPRTTVTLSYRSNAFSRVKVKNRKYAEAASASGRLNILLESTVTEIRSDTVKLEQKGNAMEIPNDAVIICAGGILPTPLLQEIGVKIDTHRGQSH
ncbi:MAG: NAD(P)-binding domain-containing protein [Gallionella sp.]|nr:NAD(P)-binding domain-containing protein [Gallionella sp.]